MAATTINIMDQHFTKVETIEELHTKAAAAAELFDGITLTARCAGFEDVWGTCNVISISPTTIILSVDDIEIEANSLIDSVDYQLKEIRINASNADRSDATAVRS